MDSEAATSSGVIVLAADVYSYDTKFSLCVTCYVISWALFGDELHLTVNIVDVNIDI